MDDFYRENILDHYKNPRNHGHIDHPTAVADIVVRVDDPKHPALVERVTP